MRKEDVKEKLLSFYEGKTSREEERALYVYFSTEENLPEDLEDDKRLFESLIEVESDRDIAIPHNLKSDLYQLIDRLEIEEKKNESFRPKLRKIFWITGVAASFIVVLILGIKHVDFFAGGGTAEVVAEQDTFSDPEEAYKATEKALLYTSAKMNKVLGHLDKGSDKNKN